MSPDIRSDLPAAGCFQLRQRGLKCSCMFLWPRCCPRPPNSSNIPIRSCTNIDPGCDLCAAAAAGLPAFTSGDLNTGIFCCKSMELRGAELPGIFLWMWLPGFTFGRCIWTFQPNLVCWCVNVCVLAGDVGFLRLITTLIPAPCFCPFLRLCGSCVGTLWIASPPKHAGPCYPAIHLCY